MPIDKRARERYRIINACFSNRQQREWTMPELLEKFRQKDIIIEKRTLERDFEAMRYDEQLGHNACIVYNRANKTYRYSDPNFTISKFPIIEEDRQVYRVAINVLQQFQGFPFLKDFEGVLDKLSKIGEFGDTDTKNIIAFEQMPYYKGHAYVDVIAKAIVNKQTLTITYTKFDGITNDHIVHPYFLKEYRGRWYVVGYSETRHYTITLGLDRMEQITEASSAFKENKRMNSEQYFAHTLGVTVGKGPAEDIVLWFSKKQAPYIKTQHLHHSQTTVTDDDSGLVINCKLITSPELINLILSYGADVKVISPMALKDTITQTIRGMVDLYPD